MTSRWGVCNLKNNNVTLNLELSRYDINASKIIKPESAQIKWSDIKPKESTPESKNDNWFTKMFN